MFLFVFSSYNYPVKSKFNIKVIVQKFVSKVKRKKNSLTLIL